MISKIRDLSDIILITVDQFRIFKGQNVHWGHRTAKLSCKHYAHYFTTGFDVRRLREYRDTVSIFYNFEEKYVLKII